MRTPMPTMIKMIASSRFIRPPVCGCKGGFSAVVVVGAAVAVVSVVWEDVVDAVVVVGCGAGNGVGAGVGFAIG
jgi:hypothetical protein